jgi:hypothetical protein
MYGPLHMSHALQQLDDDDDAFTASSPVLIRDFAYEALRIPLRRRSFARMANGSGLVGTISDVSAKSFAEYVFSSL